jgi:thioredoxin-like negative regulator of GroEL
VSTRSSDFNYKVALASGLKSLQAGRLRQAEEQFRYLLTRFPDADGGYRGLAKVLIEQEDRPSALRMLLDGGAAVAKAGHRTGAIGLYRDATALDPHDLTAHRRLAAALILAGERSAAADEYVRYIEVARLAGATERARLEVEHALERIPDSVEIAHIGRRLGMDVEVPVHASAPAVPAAVETERFTVEDRADLMRTAFGGGHHAESASPSRTAWRIVPPPAPAPAPERSSEAPVAQSEPSVDPWASESDAVADPHSATMGDGNGEGPAEDADSQAVEAKAARYLAKRDPRGGDAALEAARRYIADGRNDAASDLLLQLIASGVADHDAQRLLVDVVRTLGKRDVAKAKCQLLVQALRLDGREDLAAEVEQLALAD